MRKKAGPKQVGRPPGAAGDALLLDRFSRTDLETWKQLSGSAALAKRIGIKPPWLVTTPTKLRETLLAPGWRGMPAQFEVPANSQIIGCLLIEAGFEGILYPSSKGKGLCIALFPEVLINSESYVELIDPVPAHLGHRRLDSTTCQALMEPGDERR